MSVYIDSLKKNVMLILSYHERLRLIECCKMESELSRT